MSGLSDPFHEGIFPSIQSKPLLVQLAASPLVLSLVSWEKRPTPPGSSLLSGSCIEEE